MAGELMSLRTLVERTPDADLLREMIGFAAERLVETEVAGLTGALCGERARSAWRSAMAMATEPGRRGPAPSSCAS
jgi:hypothetical protein